MDKRLIVVGTGMLAEQAQYYLGDLGGRSIDAFVLDPQYVCEDSFLGRPVLTLGEAQRRFAPATHEAFIAIGLMATAARKRWYDTLCGSGYALASYVHPSAVVATNVAVQPGTMIQELVAVSPFARLGANVVLCVQAAVSHHTRVGDHSFFAPAARVAGAADIGERCFLGIGAIVRDRIRLGDGCVIGAGAVVMKDCPADSLVPGPRSRPR